jgi:glutamyl-tRNA synthetase
MPREGACQFHDQIRGDMNVEWATEQDHVIQRADGTCLYHLANVVDDQDMKVTHVIRAEEHLSNTPRQIFIVRGLGYPQPEYAHLPFVAEPGSRNKLSKRKIKQYLKNPDFRKIYEHGAGIARKLGMQVSEDTAESFNPVLSEFFETVGYLPEAVVNYLLLLGWSLDDRTEIFSRDDMIRLFSLERVTKAPASFDPGKLFAFQEKYMQQIPAARKVELVLPFLAKADYLPAVAADTDRRKVAAIVDGAGDRLKVAGDILDYGDLFVADEKLTYDEKDFDKRIRKPADAVPLLKRVKTFLEQAEDFDAASLEKLLQNFLDAEGIKVGQIIHAMRVAVTGKSVGFGLYETLAILGKERSVRRIEQALGRV